MENGELLEFLVFLFCTRIDFPEFYVSRLVNLPTSTSTSMSHINITRIKAINSAETSVRKKTSAMDLAELGSEIIQPVASLKELQKCLRNPKVTLCRLMADIEITENIIINRDIVLDLGGHEIKSDTKNIRVIDIVKGNVALIGTGSIIASGNGGVAVRIKGSDDPNAEKYSSITVSSEVMLQATSNDFSYGLIISPNHRAAYGVIVNLYGVIDAFNGVYVNGNVIAKKGNVPVINIDNGAAISVNPEFGTAVYAAGYGIWQIGDATLVGGNGIDIKMGRLIIDGATISTTALSGDSSAGAVIQIEDHDNNANCVDIKIKDGILTSQNNHIIYEYSNCEVRTHSLRRLRVLNGNLLAGVGKNIFHGVPEKDTVQVAGGSFNSDVFDFLAPDAQLSSTTTKDENGRMTRMWEVDGVYSREAQHNLAQKAKLQASKLNLGKIALLSINSFLEESYHEAMTDYNSIYNDIDYSDYYTETNAQEPITISSEPITVENNFNSTPVDCTILSEILAAAEDIDQSSYTAESYNKLANVLESARLILERPTLASQDDVDRIVIAVALATANLVENQRDNLHALSLATVRNYADSQPPATQEAPVVAYPESSYYDNYYNQSMPQSPATPQQNPTYMGNSNYQTYSPTYNYYNYPAPAEMMYPAWQNNLMAGTPTNYLPAQTYPTSYSVPDIPVSEAPSQNYRYAYQPTNYNNYNNYYDNHNQFTSENTSTSSYVETSPNQTDSYVNSDYHHHASSPLLAQFSPSNSGYETKQTNNNLSSISTYASANQYDNYGQNYGYQNPQPVTSYSNIGDSSLDATIAEAKEISAMDYTLSSFAKLQQAIYAAEDILHDSNVTTEELDAASFNLNLAISNLEQEETSSGVIQPNLDYYQHGQPSYY